MKYIKRKNAHYLEIEHEGDILSFINNLKEEERRIALQTLNILSLLPTYKKLRKWLWTTE